jgi:hypothetical protein
MARSGLAEAAELTAAQWATAVDDTDDAPLLAFATPRP